IETPNQSLALQVLAELQSLEAYDQTPITLPRKCLPLCNKCNKLWDWIGLDCTIKKRR
ncbi:unnamed protein product, partial [Prunus brigantina]